MSFKQQGILMKLRAFAVLGLLLCGNSWAHDGEEGRPHTHWWLEMGDAGTTWSAGATLTSNSLDDWSFASNAGSYSSAKVDNSDIGYRVHAGLDFLKYFGVELGYADYGDASFRGQADGVSFWNAGPVKEDVSTEAFDLTFTGRLDLGVDTALTARIGALQWKIDESVSGDRQGVGPFDISESDDGTDLQYGVGAEYVGLRPLRVSLGYSRARLGANTQMHDAVTLSSFSASVAYLF